MLLNFVSCFFHLTKWEAGKPEVKKHSKLMKNLGSSLEAFNGGSISRLTTGNASFDAGFSSKFAEMIKEVKGRKEQVPAEGGGSADGEQKTKSKRSPGNDVQESGENPGDASVNHEASQGHNAMSASTQQPAPGISEFGRINNDAVSPTASIDSDKTVESPRQFLRDSARKELASSPPSTDSKHGKKAAAASKRGASPKKSKSSKKSNTGGNIRTSVRVSSLGPWVCNECTFENVRNTTQKAVCEMCNNKRPDQKRQAKEQVEVVNIDC